MELLLYAGIGLTGVVLGFILTIISVIVGAIAVKQTTNKAHAEIAPGEIATIIIKPHQSSLNKLLPIIGIFIFALFALFVIYDYTYPDRFEYLDIVCVGDKCWP